MRTITAFGLLAIALVAIASCDGSGAFSVKVQPPITITYRESLFGIGSVIQLTNDSAHHLYNVKVNCRNFDENVSASVKAADELGPGEVVEVGWLEFEAWIPVAGEIVEVTCDDYLAPKVSIVPDLAALSSESP